MARSNAVVRLQPQRGLAVYQSPLVQVTPALKFGTALRPRWSEYDFSIGHSADGVPYVIRHRGKFMPLFSRADAASEILSLAMYQQPDRPMIKAMVGALLGAFGVKADKDLLGGMVDMLEGDEIAIASGLWKPLHVSPVGLALACRKLIATSPPYPPKPPELYEACREAENSLGLAQQAADKVVDFVRRCDAVLLEFAHDEWQRPYLTPEFQPLLPRMLDLHATCGDGSRAWNEADWDDDYKKHPFAALVRAEEARLALPPPEQLEPMKLAACGAKPEKRTGKPRET